MRWGRTGKVFCVKWLDILNVVFELSFLWGIKTLAQEEETEENYSNFPFWNIVTVTAEESYTNFRLLPLNESLPNLHKNHKFQNLCLFSATENFSLSLPLLKNIEFQIESETARYTKNFMSERI
jgi:hypothetical protein